MQGFDALLLEDGSELRIGSVALQKVLAVFLSKSANEGIAILATDLSILVTVTFVETRLLHNQYSHA
jgi:hypothetical protein